MTQLSEVSKRKSFRSFAIIAFIMSAVISYLAYRADNQVSTLEVAINSILVQIFIVVVGGYVLFLIAKQNNLENE